MAATTSRYRETILQEFHEQLDDIRQKELFCDVKIKLNNGENCSLSVHRAVLASCSPFFRSLFTTAMVESKKVEIELPGISKPDMESVIRFAYTKQADLNPENIESIFMTADRLHVFGLLKLCAVYLEENIDPQNVIGVWQLARHFHCMSLRDNAQMFMVRNFDQVLETSSEFLQLSNVEICEILTNNRLNVSSEHKVVLALIKWAEQEPTRRRHYYDLLACARLGYCQKWFFNEVIFKNKDIMSQKLCKEMVNHAYSLCQIKPQTKLSFYQSSSIYMLMPRVPDGVIFILGGWTNDNVCGHIETYDCRVDRWYALQNSLKEKPLAYHSLVPHGKFIYVIGGFTTYACVNTVRRWDPVKGKWEFVANMHEKRCYVGCAGIDRYIYACGGYDGQTRHSSAERYDPDENQWCYIASMRSVRSDSGVTALGGLLYVCGGFDGQTCLSSVEVYSPKSNQWTLIDDMGMQRSGVAVTAVDGCMYVVGGFDGIQRLNSVERYDPTSRRWSTVANMSLARSNFAITNLERKIYAIGGFNGTSTSNTVECYDIEKDEWKIIQHLVVGRSATSACTIYGLPNVTDYTYFGADPMDGIVMA